MRFDGGLRQVPVPPDREAQPIGRASNGRRRRRGHSKSVSLRGFRWGTAAVTVVVSVGVIAVLAALAWWGISVFVGR